MIDSPKYLNKYNKSLNRYVSQWKFIIGQLVYKLYSYGETYESIGKMLNQTGRAIRRYYPKTKTNKYA